MKLTAIIAVVVMAVLLQMTLARYMVGGRFVFDIVLVGVVYAALQWGAVAGMLAGTMGGLLQDALGGGILGVGGLAKTLTGYAAGRIGTQFVLAKPRARMLVLIPATVVHRILMLAFVGLINQDWPGVTWTVMLGETVANALCGLLAFHASEALPAAVTRNRMSRRSTFTRRQW